MRHLLTLHEQGFTPFAYHKDESGERHQHYKATAIASYFIGSILLLSTNGYWIPPLQFENFDSRDNQLFAAIGLMGMAIALGMLTGVLHFLVDRCRDVKDRSDYSVQVAEDNEIPMEDRNTSINETTGLMGQDSEKASIYRIGNYHPLRAIYPATPIKTGLWIPMVGLLIFAVAALIKPDLFSQLAGNTPVSNTTRFTNCTLPHNDTLITNATVCVSLLGNFMGFSTVLFGSLAVSMCVGTLFHYAGARATERCSQDPSVIPVMS